VLSASRSVVMISGLLTLERGLPTWRSRCVPNPYLGALTTTYVTDDPENSGWYQVDPHCWYVRPLTVTAPHDGHKEASPIEEHVATTCGDQPRQVVRPDTQSGAN
jgi:hypothetical protein